MTIVDPALVECSILRQKQQANHFQFIFDGKFECTDFLLKHSFGGYIWCSTLFRHTFKENINYLSFIHFEISFGIIFFQRLSQEKSEIVCFVYKFWSAQVGTPE